MKGRSIKPKTQRLYLLLLALALGGVGTYLILEAFRENIVFFHTPGDLKTQAYTPHQRLRLGGLVKENSLHHGEASVTFDVTDGADIIPVHYEGILPDLFREGQGVVAEGSYDGTSFHATSVLAKHDENYMPRDVQEGLKKQGYWRPGEETH